MRLAEYPLPKINSAESGESIQFIKAEEALGARISGCAGKVLLATDGQSLVRFAPLGRGMRTLSVVAEGDALPLFSMPDGVGAVFASGGADTLRIARFFAEVRKVPCYLFPVSATLEGAWEPTAEIQLGESRVRVPLANAEVFYDEALLKPTLADGYAALLLSRLSLFEERALRVLAGREKSDMHEAAYADLLDLPQTPTEIISLNARMRHYECNGLPRGEGWALANAYRENGDELPYWRAFRSLSALYYAFFKCGKPRRYFVPDYLARAERVHMAQGSLVPPQKREYAERAFALERSRAAFLSEIKGICEHRPQDIRAVRLLAGKTPPAGDAALLACLPERCGDGLSAIMRDFGLMEF
ncbi:MAG: hypothetical protein K2N84_07150 [Clostridia bacterium]|nr:hypothetical protein [Clostridia bacterium]